MFSKIFLTVIIITAVVIICVSPVVRANPPANVVAIAPAVLFNDVTCPVSSTGVATPLTGCVRHESLRPDGTGYYLSLRVGPEKLEANTFTVQLPYSFTVRRLTNWIGTGQGSMLEVQSLFQYRKPDGSGAEFLAEFDKHTDISGEKQIVFNFTEPLVLPAGTVITITHNAGYAGPQNNCNPWQICATDMIWSLYSE